MGKKITVILFLILGMLTGILVWQLNRTMGSIAKNLAAPLPESPKLQYRLALIYQSNNNPSFWGQIKQGAARAATTERVYVNFMEVVHGAEMGLIDYLRLAIAADYDGIIIPGDDEQIVPFVQEASNAGIPTWMIASDLPESGRIGYVGANNYQAGYAAGKAMMAGVKSGGNPLLAVVSPATGRNLQMSVAESSKIFGFREAISFRHTIVPIWERVSPNLVDSMMVIRNLLRRYPELDGIYATYPAGALAAARVVAEQKAVGRVAIVGHGDTPALREYISSGVIDASIVEYPYQMGYTAVKEMTRYLHQGWTNIASTVDTVVLDRRNLGWLQKRGGR